MVPEASGSKADPEVILRTLRDVAQLPPGLYDVLAAGIAVGNLQARNVYESQLKSIVRDALLSCKADVAQSLEKSREATAVERLGLATAEEELTKAERAATTCDDDVNRRTSELSEAETALKQERKLCQEPVRKEKEEKEAVARLDKAIAHCNELRDGLGPETVDTVAEYMRSHQVEATLMAAMRTTFSRTAETHGKFDAQVAGEVQRFFDQHLAHLQKRRKAHEAFQESAWAEVLGAQALREEVAAAKAAAASELGAAETRKVEVEEQAASSKRRKLAQEDLVSQRLKAEQLLEAQLAKVGEALQAVDTTEAGAAGPSAGTVGEAAST